MIDSLRSLSSRSTSIPGLVGVVAIYLGSLAIIDPRGEFPLNDDWAYALPVKALVETGELRLTDWQSMPLLPQLGLGALFCSVFGWSFEVLRATTVTMGVVAIVSVHGLARRFGASPGTATLASLTLAVNPIFLALSCTFMTDVPFLGLVTASAYLLSRRDDAASHRRAGVALGILATLLRQTGFAVLLAHAMRPGRSPRLARALPVLGAAVLLAVHEAALDAAGMVPSLYHAKSDALWASLRSLATLDLAPIRPAARLFYLSLYAGLLLLPWTSMLLCRARARWLGRTRTWLAALVVLPTASVALWPADKWLPRMGNILVETGVGPLTLPTDGLASMAERPWAWGVLTALGVASCIILALACGRALHRVSAPRREPAAFALVWLAAGLAPLLLVEAQIFDRYLLLLLPPLVLLSGLGVSSDRVALGCGAVVGLVVAAGSVASVHAYMEWNRARWELAGQLDQRYGVAAASIDGGFEFNHYTTFVEREAWQGVPLPLRRPDAPYAITARPARGDLVLLELEVDAWWGAVPRLHAVRRNEQR